MKQKIIGIMVIGILATIIFRFGMVAGAATNEPGTTGDPLITKSYLDKRLGELNISSNSEASYKKISVTKGKQLLVKEGSEFVIYSGEATVFGEKGVINLTSGGLIKSGGKVESYENYLSLSDASGIKASASCIIYVKGDYTIK